MKAIFPAVCALFLLAACSGAPEDEKPEPQVQPQAAEQAPPAEQPQPAEQASAPVPGCGVPPWSRASQALGRPVLESISVRGKPVYTIKGATYAEIVMDHDLTGGVRLTDPRGLEPAPGTVFNIVWTEDDVVAGGAPGCGVRYSAPSFLDMK